MSHNTIAYFQLISAYSKVFALVANPASWDQHSEVDDDVEESVRLALPAGFKQEIEGLNCIFSTEDYDIETAKQLLMDAGFRTDNLEFDLHDWFDTDYFGADDHQALDGREY